MSEDPKYARFDRLQVELIRFSCELGYSGDELLAEIREKLEAGDPDSFDIGVVNWWDDDALREIGVTLHDVWIDESACGPSFPGNAGKPIELTTGEKGYLYRVIWPCEGRPYTAGEIIGVRGDGSLIRGMAHVLNTRPRKCRPAPVSCG